MKVIISNKQYKLLKEQSDYAMDRRSNALLNATGIRSDKDYKEVNKTINKAQADSLTVDPHILMTVLQIGTAFIPFAGPFISAAIGLLDAATYYNEGDKKTAGLTAAFTMLPFIGPVVSKIPGVKQLGAKGMAALSSKLSKGSKLSKLEMDIVNAIKTQQGLIKSELESAGKVLTAIQNTIFHYKPGYIKKFGQIKYDALLSDLLSKKITKEEFVKRLKSYLDDTWQLADWSVKSGIKFSVREMKDLSFMANKVKLGKPVSYRMTMDVKGIPKQIEVIIDHFPDVNWRGQAKGGYQIRMNLAYTKNMTLEQIRQVLFHEAAHIKDPGMVSKVLNKSYNEIVKNSDELGKAYKDLFDIYKKTKGGYDDLVKTHDKYKAAFAKYKFHPREIIANNQMVLNNMVDQIEMTISAKGPQGAKKVLDDLLLSLSNKKDFSQDAIDLLGVEGVEQIVQLGAYNKKLYQDFLKKITKQVQDLKSQLNLLD